MFILRVSNIISLRELHTGNDLFPDSYANLLMCLIDTLYLNLVKLCSINYFNRLPAS